MLTVCVEPTCGVQSKSMHRVAAALRASAPSSVWVVDATQHADIQVLHTIGPWVGLPTRYAVIQHCVGHAEWAPAWQELWRNARLVWSHYDLSDKMPAGSAFYHAPLGVDGEVFRGNGHDRDLGVMTSGTVAGPEAESIEEVADAAWACGLKVVHLGPRQVVGMNIRNEYTWKSIDGVQDSKLAEYYGRCKWVSGLRQIEGFELPVIEGLACGARPIVFDRPDMRRWYDGLAVFVPVCHGNELVNRLVDIFLTDPEPVSDAERALVLERFRWSSIAKGFWSRLLEVL